MKRYLYIVLSLSAGLLVYMTRETGVVRNYLPDLLWGFALLQTAIWMQEKNFHPGFIYALLALPVLTETGQLGLFPGTFDTYDLFIYIVLLSIFFHLQIIQLCKRVAKHL